MKLKIQLAAAFFAVAVLLSMTACTGDKLEYRYSKTYDYYFDRARVEKLDDKELLGQSIDMEQMKKDKNIEVGVKVEVNFQETSGARIPHARAFAKDCAEYAVDFAARTGAYKITYISEPVTEKDMLNNAQYAKKPFQYFIYMYISLNTEVKEGDEIDKTIYKTSINWKLIDNRTKVNGLGDNDRPYVKKSMSCSSATARPTEVRGVTANRMGGSNSQNAQNAFKNTLQYALMDFRAQLVNEIPYGGKISDVLVQDGEIYMILKSGSGRLGGIVPGMQMLIRTERGFPVAVATANGGGKASESMLQVWRWISKDQKKKIKGLVEDSDKMAEWLDKKGNALYAVCLGMPRPPKHEQTKIDDDL